jgi:hypothetical protein
MNHDSLPTKHAQNTALGLARTALTTDESYQTLRATDMLKRKDLHVARLRVTKTTGAIKTLKRKLADAERSLQIDTERAERLAVEHAEVVLAMKNMETAKADAILGR